MSPAPWGPMQEIARDAKQKKDKNTNGPKSHPSKREGDKLPCPGFPGKKITSTGKNRKVVFLTEKRGTRAGGEKDSSEKEKRGGKTGLVAIQMM